MIKFLKRIAAAFTAAIIVINTTVVCFAQSYSTVVFSSKTVTPLSFGQITYTYGVGTYTKYNTTLNERVYTVEAKLDKNTYIDVTSGGSLYGKSTLSSKLAKYTDKNGGRVVAAVNGDFFSSTTGLALGLQITNGIVRATNSYNYEQSVGRYSVGFRADGTAVVGIPNIKLTLAMDSAILEPDRVNAYPDTNLVALTRDYADKTYWNTAFAHDVAVIKLSDSLKLDSSFSCEFISYTKNVTEPVTMQDGYLYIIAPRGDARMSAMFEGKTGGYEITASTADKTGLFSGVVTAIGGGNLLINNGTMRYPSTYDSAISNSLTSRTAIGIKADNSVVFYVAEKDKTASLSGGLRIEAVTQALYDMGCVYAVNLDGGGSSTIAVSENGGQPYVKNSCQDGSERRVSNCIVLVTNEKAPVIVEDFETLAEFTTVSGSEDAVAAQLTNDNAYTGKTSLKIDYTLKGLGSSVGAFMQNGIDVTAFDRLNFAVYGIGSNTKLTAVFEKEGAEYKKDVCSLDFKGYKRYEVLTDGSSSLRGFELSYQLASDRRGYVIIDRIVGYDGYSLSDSNSPVLSAKQENGKLISYSADGTFESGNDINGYSFSVDGSALVTTLENGGAFADITAQTGNKIQRAIAVSQDIFGNRAKSTVLFKTFDYSKQLPFVDMREGGWDELYIRYCNENGIINGFEENGTAFFRGSQSITRTQFCVMLVKQQGIDISKYTDTVLPYEDLKDISNWSLPYVKAAYATGIMQGSATYTGVAFNPNANITRSETASAIDRIAQKDARVSMKVNFKDSLAFPKWASIAINSVSSQGLFNGDADGNFYPRRNLSRSEACAIMSRM